jgi:hypothetical protein
MDGLNCSIILYKISTEFDHLPTLFLDHDLLSLKGYTIR